jgi:predicted transcriptional regulator
MASVRIPEETLHRLEAVAQAMGSDADTIAAEALAAYVDDEGAFVAAVNDAQADAQRGEVVPDEELESGTAATYPHDWNDYLRYRFEEGRKAVARGEFFDGPPAELIARIRERVEAKHR